VNNKYFCQFVFIITIVRSIALARQQLRQLLFAHFSFILFPKALFSTSVTQHSEYFSTWRRPSFSLNRE